MRLSSYAANLVSRGVANTALEMDRRAQRLPLAVLPPWCIVSQVQPGHGERSLPFRYRFSVIAAVMLPGGLSKGAVLIAEGDTRC